MHHRSFFLALAAGILACSFGPMTARAGTVLVTEDAGTFSFSLTSNGAGQLTFSYTTVLLTTINTVVVPTGPIVSTLGTTTVDVTSTVSAPPFTTYGLSEPTAGTKNFGTGPGSIDTASLNYKVVSGYAINPGFLNIVGSVTGVTAPLLETTATSPTIYDFSAFRGSNILTLTYNEAGADFASVIAKGGTIIGTGGFSEVAIVPEPCSMALLGIGMTSFLAYRRFFKRTTVA